MYKNYSSYLKTIFDEQIQKISINAGFTCPNRDGSAGTGGCTYCNNQTFNPDYCKPEKSITQQLDEGIAFFRKKYPYQRYLSYFQAYTNTYGEINSLKQKYEEALSHPLVAGLVIGTRPDCVNDELLDYLAFLSKYFYIMIEYGVESTSDQTLTLINRGHNYETSVQAITKTAQKGITTGAHLILGLPGEKRETILSHAKNISQLPLTTIKLHQLQLIRGTKMAQQFAEHPEWFHLYTADEYIELAIDFIELLNPGFVIERFVSQSPKELLVAPDWGLKNYEFTAKIEKAIRRRGTFQGRLFFINGAN
jgi:radical SAM protein (TIGR01212 family)